jgi:hypothetical protein
MRYQEFNIPVSRFFRILVPIFMLLAFSAISIMVDHTVEAQEESEAGYDGALPLRRNVRSKAGINEGILVGVENNVFKVIQGEVINPAKSKPYVPDLNMGYMVAMVIDKKAQPAIDFIIRANTQGYIPVLRLCYPDPAACKFKSASDIYGFYEKVAQGLAGTNYVVVASLGPNEPGSGEAGAFGVAHGDYTTLVNWANKAAEYLQPYRVRNGGNLYLGPAIFNGTNSVPGSDDVRGYLYSQPSINADYFDFILTNLYNDGGKPAKYFYKEDGRSMRKYIKAHPHLSTIIIEYGYKPYFGEPFDLELYKTQYVKLCSDKTISGINFFRPMSAEKLPPSYPAYGPRQNPAIKPKTLHSIVQSCTVTSPL